MQTGEMIKSSEEFYKKQTAEEEEKTAIREEQKQKRPEKVVSNVYFANESIRKMKNKAKNRKRNAISKQSRKVNRSN
jgi:hypothetical protein